MLPWEYILGQEEGAAQKSRREYQAGSQEVWILVLYVGQVILLQFHYQMK